ncbi:MAG: hypothetical protein K2X48_07745 [Chitinophagaceae bacterium]|nr:hypothetical protein [Chitinophagaceae bacterium]
MRKFLGIFTVVLVLALSGFIYYKYYFTFSEGYRSGLLQKFSHKGNLFKTYEGEIILSSIRSNNNVALASEKFLFSVADKNVAAQMELQQGRMVTVHYHEKKGTLPWRGDSEYIVDSVKLEQ